FHVVLMLLPSKVRLRSEAMSLSTAARTSGRRAVPSSFGAASGLMGVTGVVAACAVPPRPVTAYAAMAPAPASDRRIPAPSALLESAPARREVAGSFIRENVAE